MIYTNYQNFILKNTQLNVTNIIGLGALPSDTFEDQYKELCKKLFGEIEEKKEHYKRLEDATKKRYRDDLEERVLKEQFRVLTEEEWETTRQERVSCWKTWSNRKAHNNVVGTRKSSGFLRPPPVKPEERTK